MKFFHSRKSKLRKNVFCLNITKQYINVYQVIWLYNENRNDSRHEYGKIFIKFI